MVGMYKQTRLREETYPFRIQEYRNGRPNQVFTGSVVIPGRQTTISYRSRGREEDRIGDSSPSLFPFPTGDTGHPFDTVKETCKTSTRQVVVPRKKNPAPDYTFSGYGPVLVRSDTGQPASVYNEFPQVPSLSSNEAKTLGARYILSSTPTSSQANLLLTISELVREGLPAIPALSLKQGSLLKNLGGESLNYQFGIAPLISDLQKIARAVLEAPTILEQFRKDSGKVITRRRTTEHPSVTTTGIKSMYPYAPLYGGAGLSAAFYSSPEWSGSVESLTRVETTTRFVGAFQYELDIGDDAISRLKSFEAQANQLLGTRLSPELLWNLAPWSWLTDWFANIGDILGNAGNFAADGLVLKYGYLMRHTVATRYLTLAPHVFGNTSNTWVSRFRTERKERVQATPFGFGTSIGSLSDYQIGIVGSLAAANTPNLERSSRSPRR